MTKNFVSIILPAYNAESTIPKVIRSLLQQTFRNFELIIINDGSTDNTLLEVLKFKDTRIKTFTYKKNKGISYALNYGISKSTGDYIARADADDFCSKSRVMKQVVFLDKNLEYDICGTFQIILKNKSKYKSSTAVTHKEILSSLVFRPTMKHSTIMFRRSCLNIFGHNVYRKRFFLCEDYDLWVRLSKTSKFCNLPYYSVEYDWSKPKLWEEGNSRLSSNLKSIYNQTLNNLFYYRAGKNSVDIHCALLTGNFAEINYIGRLFLLPLHTLSIIVHLSVRKNYSLLFGLKILTYYYALNVFPILFGKDLTFYFINHFKKKFFLK